MGAIVEIATQTMVIISLKNGMQLIADPEKTFLAAKDYDNYKEIHASNLTPEHFLKFGNSCYVYEEKIADVEYVKVERIVG